MISGGEKRSANFSKPIISSITKSRGLLLSKSAAMTAWCKVVLPTLSIYTLENGEYQLQPEYRV